MASRDARWGLLFRAGACLAWLAWALWRIASDSFVVGETRYFDALDDAMISLRYGWNWANGQGIVWNPGEAVEGYSNPLLVATSALLSVFLTRESVVLAVQLLGAACVLGSAAFADAILRQLWRDSPPVDRALRETGRACVVIATLACFPLSRLALHGMETGLLTVALLFTVWLSLRPGAVADPRSAAVLSASAALVYLCRSDAAVPALLVLLFAAQRARAERRSVVVLGALLAPFAAAIVLHLLWRRGYYGTWLPNTYALKIAGVSTAERIVDGLAYLRSFVPEAWAAGLLAAAGVVLSPREARRPYALLGMIVGALVAGYAWAGGDFLPRMWRFIVPALPLLWVLAFEGARLGAARLRAEGSSGLAPVAAFAVALAIASLPHRGAWLPGEDQARRQQTRQDVMAAVLLRAVTRDDASVGVLRAGHLPYYADRQAIDFLGKMDPKVAALPPHRDVAPIARNHGARMWPGHAKYDLAYSLRERRPDVAQQLAWLEDDQRAWARDHYLMLSAPPVVLYLARGSAAVDWQRLRCDEATCRLRADRPAPW